MSSIEHGVAPLVWGQLEGVVDSPWKELAEVRELWEGFVVHM